MVVHDERDNYEEVKARIERRMKNIERLSEQQAAIRQKRQERMERWIFQLANAAKIKLSHD